MNFWALELILVQGCQPAGNQSHKHSGRQPVPSPSQLLSNTALGQYQITLPDDRGTWIWTTCLG